MVNGSTGMSKYTIEKQYTTRQEIEDRIAETTGQHTHWLRFEEQECAWFNGSDFVCQMNRWDTDTEGEGLIAEWAPRHQVTA